MLDENLPTFRFRAAPDSPTDSLLHYTHSGSDPTPAFLIRRPDPSTSPSRYAAALSDPSLPSIIYGETLVTPTWASPPSDPRASPPREPLPPPTVALTLYNPDQTVTLRHSPSGWNRSESWDFELPERTFRVPSASQLDRADTAPAQDAAVPKIAFRWKKDGRMSRDMTCYMVGRSEGGKRSREPDITVALFSQKGEGCAVTVYEPNMRRVEIEDRKGLEVVLLLGAEAIRSLYLGRGDPYNLAAAGPGAAKRRESRPPPGPAAPATMMTPATAAPAKKQTGDRERRDREEQERIRRMLEAEEAREKRRRDAEVDAETERLRKVYGVPQPQGPASANPPLPPRPGYSPALAPPSMPPRPLSAGPFPYGVPAYGQAPAQGRAQQASGQGLAQAPRKKAECLINGLLGRGEREREEERRKKVHKKRSVHF